MINVRIVMPGQAKASTPKMIAATPRNKSIHQFFANACTITDPRPIPGGRPTCIVLMTTSPNWLEAAPSSNCAVRDYHRAPLTAAHIYLFRRYELHDAAV